MKLYLHMTKIFTSDKTKRNYFNFQSKVIGKIFSKKFKNNKEFYKSLE